MPSNQTVWGIEIGQCALKALRVRHNAETGKVEALAFDYIEHPKILSQPDADPDQLSRDALQTFLSRNQVKGDRVVIGVPGQSGLARFIKLPPVEQSRIPEIVRYEARQQIPFALEEVVWDFQTIGKADETEGFALETEIGLFAMKRDLIHRYMSPFRETGVEVDMVQMRPLAVYNFAGFDRISAEAQAEPDDADKEKSEYQREELLEGKKPEPTSGGFIVLLDMGSDNSDLVITDGTRIWQRNLPIGGNHFTRALTKELKLTFAKAEHLKRNATKAQDPRAIFQAMRPVFNDLVSEIQRSIGYFSSVHRQSKITTIIGMGNAFKLPGLQKFLSQNLQYEVEKVESLSRLTGDSVITAPAFQENILSFSVVYGLTLQGLEVAGIRTNLLPPEITQTRMIRRKKPWALTAAAILLVAFTSLFFGNWSQLNAVTSQAFDTPVSKAKTAGDNFTQKKDAFEGAVSQWKEVKSNGELLTANVEKRLEWFEVLDVINKALPDNPANVTDRKKLRELGEMHISDIKAEYYDDVKAGWWDGAIKTYHWADSSHLPADKAEPPSGPGWVFTLYGSHFHKDTQLHTLYSLATYMKGFHSPNVRQVGIRGALLDYNFPKNFVPGSDTGPRKRPSASGGGAAPAAPRGGGAGGGGMGMGGGGGGGAAANDEPPSRNDDPGAGGGGGGVADAESRASVAMSGGILRTEFTLSFIWQPIEKEKRKTIQEIVGAIEKQGPNKQVPTEAVLKSEGPRATNAPTAGAPASGAQPSPVPGSAQPSAPAQPGNPPAPGVGQPAPGANQPNTAPGTG